ncbi:MAG: tetratricopeptide repeat protein [Gammaproteobacteria bacterium]
MPSHIPSRIIQAAAATLALLALQSAHADEYSAGLKARRHAEVERAASARLAQDPNDADALVAKNRAILGSGDTARTDEAVKLGETCVARHPNHSRCQLALGEALGTRALTNGVLSALGYAGTIREAFKKAVELDPKSVDARFSLLDYYLNAPGIVGGGADKGRALVTQTATVLPDAAKLMQAKLDIMDGNKAKAESAVLGVRAGDNDELADHQAELLYMLGGIYANEKKFADAERVFKAMQQRVPEHELTLFGTGRVLQEQGKHREALASFEQALVKMPRPHVWYRIGQSWQAVGDKAKAGAAYQKALSFKTGLPDKQRDDAERQLKSLKS